MNCVDCEEYDKEKHYCPKFCSVIRNTMDEIIRDSIPVEWIKENKNLARTVGAWQYELFLDTLLKDWEEERKEE